MRSTNHMRKEKDFDEEVAKHQEWTVAYAELRLVCSAIGVMCSTLEENITSITVDALTVKIAGNVLFIFIRCN